MKKLSFPAATLLFFFSIHEHEAIVWGELKTSGLGGYGLGGVEIVAFEREVPLSIVFGKSLMTMVFPHSIVESLT